MAGWRDGGMDVGMDGWMSGLVLTCSDAQMCSDESKCAVMKVCLCSDKKRSFGNLAG